MQHTDLDYFIEFVQAAVGAFAHMADCLVITAPVDVTSFTATPNSDGIYFEWETAAEIGIQGFHLYRQELCADPIDGASAAPPLRLNGALIPSQADSAEGAAYSFLDASASKGLSYSYWLEVIDAHGQATRHGPLRVEPARLYLPLLAYPN